MLWPRKSPSRIRKAAAAIEAIPPPTRYALDVLLSMLLRGVEASEVDSVRTIIELPLLRDRLYQSRFQPLPNLARHPFPPRTNLMTSKSSRAPTVESMIA